VPGTHVVDILLLDLPVALWAAAREHVDALAGALAPFAEQDPDGAPARLLALRERLDGDFAETAAPSELELRAAAAKRTAQLDVAYGVPRDARDDVAALVAAYDGAEAFCLANGLGHLVAPPDVAAFRRWFLGQIVAQLDGAIPEPWLGH
jgi:hypothetical protein